jgi:predicted CXXCH cytochrome family protein
MLALVLLLVSGGTTGEYHAGAQLICVDCHTMHYSDSHDLSGNACPGANCNLPLGSGGPFPRLLRNEETALCLTCHDGQNFAPDVLGAHANGYIRQAGALNKVGGVDNYQEWMGHTLGSTTQAPGGTWTPSATGLTCINCHSAHGASGNDVANNGPDPNRLTGYRNLSRSRGGIASGSPIYTIVSYAKETNVTTRDVFLRGWTKGNLAGNYSDTNVDFNEPVTNKSGMGQWCQGCHTHFHGDKTSTDMYDTTAAHFVRHPAADADITGSTFKNKLYRVKVMSQTGDWGVQGQAWASAPATLTPTCPSCHKGHGNKNPFGLIYALGAGAFTEEGDGVAVRDLCRQCHGMGTVYPN